MGGEKLPVTSTVSETFPHCLGAVDGKHVAMKCPFRGGSRHYNYNGFFTVVGETGASWRTGQDDESALVLKIITILHLSVCHTCHHVCA